MNCTKCGKPHRPEYVGESGIVFPAQPLTIIDDKWLCAICLAELDEPLYGISPVEVAKAHVKSVYSNAILKIGDVELPVESFEMR
jgi:hypothetical protein